MNSMNRLNKLKKKVKNLLHFSKNKYNISSNNVLD